jgi:organic hydroperoxide reductase OsmC/OhrA
MEAAVVSIELVLQDEYRFQVDFCTPEVPLLVTDASPPLGKGAGPDSEKLLIAAVANCLSASLLFSLRKFKNEAVSLRTVASAQLLRNEQGRLRMGSIDVRIHLGVPAGDLRLLDRALAQYEDFCVVTQSVRLGIPVHVTVVDGAGIVIAG